MTTPTAKPTNGGNMLNKQEWTNRFVAHMLKRGMEEAFSRDLAEGSYASGLWDADDTPEDVAEEELYNLAN